MSRHELSEEDHRRREAQALRRIAGRAARLGGWTLDLRDGMLTWSDEVCDIHEVPHGYAPSLDEGIRFFPPEVRAEVRRILDACAQDGTPYDFEMPKTTATGRRIWVRSIGEAVRDPEGRIIGVQGAFQDISQRKQADEALRASEERFRLLAKATSDAVWDWDLVTDAVWWSEGFETLFGYQRSELSANSESWTEHIHPADSAGLLADIRRAIAGDAASWSAEYRFRRSDGSYLFVLDRGHILRDASGRAVRMIGGMSDLTARKRAEQRIFEQATLLDRANDAIMVLDLEHRIDYWNKAAERLYGWDAQEARGRHLDDLLRVAKQSFEAAQRAVRETGEWKGEILKTSRSGEVLTIQGSWTLLRDEAQAPRSILIIDTDITERKRLEQQFLRAQRLESIGTLAGGIAHDLNNVLAPILFSLEMLRLDEQDPERMELLVGLEESAQRGAALVRQVLGFARGVEGRLTAVDLGQLAVEIQQVLGETFPKNIELSLDIADEPWSVTADPTQMHQVLVNLCVNARDAMADGGRLVITVANVLVDETYAALNLDAKPGPHVMIKVVDTGVGIPYEIQDRVFDPFFTTKEVGKGTGLGLATVMTIVKSHGGFLNLYSEPGKGTKLKVYLPAGGDSPDRKPKVLAQRRLPHGKGELILIVDDEASIREVVRRTLERFGYRVMVAAHGAEAVAIYAQHGDSIAAVLTDMAMPVMDGPATILALLAMDPAVKIIGCSGHATGGGVSRALGAGVEYFVPKPYTAETLLGVLAEVLGDRG